MLRADDAEVVLLCTEVGVFGLLFDKPLDTEDEDEVCKYGEIQPVMIKANQLYIYDLIQLKASVIVL